MRCEENTKPLINESYIGYDLEINSNLVLKAIKRVCNGKTNDSRRLMGKGIKIQITLIKANCHVVRRREVREPNTFTGN